MMDLLFLRLEVMTTFTINRPWISFFWKKISSIYAIPQNTSHHQTSSAVAGVAAVLLFHHTKNIGTCLFLGYREQTKTIRSVGRCCSLARCRVRDELVPHHWLHQLELLILAGLVTTCKRVQLLSFISNPRVGSP